MREHREDTVKPGSRRRSLRGIAAALVWAATLATPAVAQAQARTFYLDRLFMAGAPDDAIGLWRPQMGEKTRFFGQLWLGFSLNPFRINNEVADPQQRAL